MTPTAKKFESLYEQFLKLPDSVVGEILSGELQVSPRPAPKHALASSIIGGEIIGPYNRGRGGPGGWIILFEPEIHLESNILVPDLAGWRREVLPAIPDEAFFTTAPNWICEVLSPGTAAIDRVKKMPLYAQYGVEHAWLVDPVAKTLEVFRLENERWSLLKSFAGDDLVRAEPFDAIEIELGVLWA
jgi:Uma2 family endonuclease